MTIEGIYEIEPLQMGHPKNMQFTAIGDAVNTASRIEATVKGTPASLLVSEAVFEQVKHVVRTGIAVTAQLKGKHGSYCLHEVVGLQHPNGT